MWAVWALYAVSLTGSTCLLAEVGPPTVLLLVATLALAAAFVQLARVAVRP